MKIQLYWLLSAALLLLPGKADAANNKKPFVIPELQEWRGSQGMFTPAATSRIVYTGKDPAVARVATQFAEDYELMFGRQMKVVQGGASAGDFVLTLSSDSRLGEEGYNLKITDRVTRRIPRKC